jgi:hypothetical protein
VIHGDWNGDDDDARFTTILVVTILPLKSNRFDVVAVENVLEVLQGDLSEREAGTTEDVRPQEILWAQLTRKELRG